MNVGKFFTIIVDGMGTGVFLWQLFQEIQVNLLSFKFQFNQCVVKDILDEVYFEAFPVVTTDCIGYIEPGWWFHFF